MNEGATQSEVDSAVKGLNTAKSALKEVFNPDSYSAVAYTDVARNPDTYKGEKLRFSGKVLQVMEGTSENNLRVATDGKYDDVVFVGYDPKIMESRILEDDFVTIYGECIGLYSYTSTMGAKISLSGIYANTITID